MEQKIRDREVIEEKSRRLEDLATRLAKYLSPQVYQSIFSDTGGQRSAYARKNLTIFLSDIVQFTPKGFVRPVQVYKVGDFLSEEHRERRRRLSRVGKRVEVNIIDSSDIRAAIEELRQIQEEFEKQMDDC